MNREAAKLEKSGAKGKYKAKKTCGTRRKRKGGEMWNDHQ